MKHETAKHENLKQTRAVRFHGFGFRVFVWLAMQLWGSAAHAHEIGTTRVSVVFQEERLYKVEIVTDAATLVEKLAAGSGESAPGDLGPSAIQSMLTRFDDTFRQRVHLRFDGLD